MKKSEERQIAISAAKGLLRRLGFNPLDESAEDALITLDDFYRVSPEMIASLWYGNACDAQIALFKQEWRRWQKKERQMI